MIALSERILLSRTDRPDEWSMDDYSREAKKLEDRITELEEKSIEAWIDNQNGSSYPEGVDSAWEKSAYEAAKRSAVNFYKVGV